MGKIMVIDDEVSILDFCKDLFATRSHSVLPVRDGKAGLILLEKEKPDLVLLDLHLVDESGLDLLPLIKAKSPKTPVVIYSGFIDADVEKKAFGAGASDVIAKGGPVDELRNKVDKLIVDFNSPAPQKKTEKILVVDDEVTIRQFLVTFLMDKGYDVIEARSGEEAVELVRKEKPNLMLLDMNMPGIDGLETLRRIRQFDKEIGVVMATANQDEEIARKAAELGSYQYVLKPFDLKYLELVVLTRLLMA